MADASRDQRHDFTPFACLPGVAIYRTWRRDLMATAASRSDDSGSTLADYFGDADMGGTAAGAPRLPPITGARGNALSDANKMQRLRTARRKNAYALIVKHITDQDVLTVLSTTCFQDGRAALQYMDANYDRALERSELRSINREWDDLSIAKEVGVREDTCVKFLAVLRRVNGERPAGPHRHDDDTIAEKFLEAISDASSKFSESALDEIDQPPGSRRFETAAGGRNLNAIVAYYDKLWKAEVKAGRLTRTQPQRGGAQNPPRHQIDAARRVSVDTPQRALRASSPTASLRVLHNAGFDVRNNTNTTSDFTELDDSVLAAAVEETCQLCDTSNLDDLDDIARTCSERGFTIETVYDADGTPSVEIVCDNCGGAGHVTRVCPSAKRHRSCEYLLALIKARFDRKEARARQAGNPPGGRRPPPRGQHAPFRPQPRRLQPRRFMPRQNARVAEEEEREDESERETHETQRSVRIEPKTEKTQSSVEHTQVEEGAALMPLDFSLDDDTAFSAELARKSGVGETTRCVTTNQTPAPKPASPSILSMIGAMLTLMAAIVHAAVNTTAEAASTLLRHIAEHRLPIGLVTIAFLVTFSVATQACIVPPDSTTPLERVPEKALVSPIGSIRPSVALTPMCVDSGATSHCISLKLTKRCPHLVESITDHAPDSEVKVGDAQKLQVVKVATLVIPHVPGLRIENNTCRAVETQMRLQRFLIVDGLDEDIIILSVRKMKSIDGIRIFLDDDNSYGVDECLRLPDGTFVPFGTDGHAYEIYPGSPLADSALSSMAANLFTPPRHRLRIHASLGHAGRTRIAMSNVTFRGQKIPLLPNAHDCPGCRAAAPCPPDNKGLTGGRRPHSETRTNLTFFGQLVASDTTYGFTPSFPHGFTSAINFCDIYSGDRDHFYLVDVCSSEVLSATGEYIHKNHHLLKDGKVWTFLSDNGTEYGSIDELTHDLIHTHQHSVPYRSNSNPYPESDHRVMRRATIAAIHYARPDSSSQPPLSLWPWAYHQCSLIFHFLATTTHQPPCSAYQFLHPEAPPADLGWAHVLFCDVTVALPERDRNGKMCERNVDACHLCYDANRREYICYVPSVKRISTFKVTSWRDENQFTIAATLTADTPVDYTQDDLPVGPRTASLLPSKYTSHAARPPRAPPLPRPRPAPLRPPPPPPGLAPAPPLVPLATAADDYYGPPVLPPCPPTLSARLIREGECSAVGIGTTDERAQAKSNFTKQTPQGTEPLTELDHAIEQMINGGEFDSHRLVWVHEDTMKPLDKAFYISATTAAYTTSDSTPHDPSAFPTDIESAKQSKYWPLVKQAMEDEIKGKFSDNEAWDVVPREAWMHVIKSRWVLQFKLNDDHSLKAVKARFVGCGYGQIAGLEYKDIFSSTLTANSFRTLCDIIADEDLETDSIDARRAFTQSDVDCEIYVEMPIGFARKGHVLKLKKALEGIKQGSHLWFKLNLNALEKLGLVASVTDPNILTHPAFRLVMGVFADDVLVGYARSATEQYTRLKAEYAALIKLGSLEIVPISIFIGVNVTRNREARTITLTQTPYIERLADKYKGQFKPCATPVRAPDKFESLNSDISAPVDRLTFLSICGGLLWPANMTRPDILYTVAFLCTFMSEPRQAHFDAALDILGYLVYTKTLGITFGGRLVIPMGLNDFPEGFAESNGFYIYHDSSWGKVPQPFGGFVGMLHNGPVLYSANKVKIVPHSSCEAEAAQAAKASRAAIAERIILEDLGRSVVGPTAHLGDNKACRDVIVKPGATKLTNYFERTIMFIKLLYMRCVLAPFLIGTDYMVADIFTKALPRDKFYKFRDFMMNVANAPGTTICGDDGRVRVLRGKAARLWSKLLSVLGE